MSNCDELMESEYWILKLAREYRDEDETLDFDRSIENAMRLIDAGWLIDAGLLDE